MVRRPGYGEHLASAWDPDILERQASAPPGFADAVGWISAAATGERDAWHTAFTVADRDASVGLAEKLGATVLDKSDTEWTKTAEVRDPQGAVFTLSQFTPPDGW
jgi:predicted enzyme related to lactoylglutathione lyase